LKDCTIDDHISAGTDTFCRTRQQPACIKLTATHGPETARAALTIATTLTPLAAAGGKVPDFASAKPIRMVDRIFSVGANAAD
jgi:hypothetical protein